METQFDTLQITKNETYAIVTIDNGKVNAINTQLVLDLAKCFDSLNTDNSIKGVILSGRPHCFSAGLDVMHLGQNTPDQNKDFWRAYIAALNSMIRFEKPFVCAITGFAPAGATILALTADYRIMSQGDKHKMGMHEFKMSMQIPELLCDIYAYYMGEKDAWEAVQNAKLYNSDQAVAVGLVHESVKVEEVLPKAEKHLKKMMNVYQPVYVKSKKYFRKGLIDLLDRALEPMIDVISAEWEDPFVKKSMEMFLASLKK